MNVMCPPNAGPGQQLTIQTPSGQTMSVMIPAGVHPGGNFQVQVPAPAPQMAVAMAMPPPQAGATPMVAAAGAVPMAAAIPMGGQPGSGSAQAVFQPAQVMQGSGAQFSEVQPMIGGGGGGGHEILAYWEKAVIDQNIDMAELIGIEIANTYKIFGTGSQLGGQPFLVRHRRAGRRRSPDRR